MLPRGMNPKQMNQMMKKLGINVKEIKNVKKVIIKTDKKQYVFDQAEVTIMNAQGEKTYQIAGTPRVESLQEEIPKEDIDLIMNQTGASAEDAINALKNTKGDIAEAIMQLSEE